MADISIVIQEKVTKVVYYAPIIFLPPLSIKL